VRILDKHRTFCKWANAAWSWLNLLLDEQFDR